MPRFVTNGDEMARLCSLGSKIPFSRNYSVEMGSARARFARIKTVTIEEVEKNFPALLRIVQRGEELNVVRRKKPVARIVPVTGITRSSRTAKKRRTAWTEHFTKLDAIYGGKPALGKPGSQVIIEDRR
jgi:antitoxin (DNA-binding transcriptional repressor) of toxin-antitoxin stability system